MNQPSSSNLPVLMDFGGGRLIHIDTVEGVVLENEKQYKKLNMLLHQIKPITETALYLTQKKLCVVNKQE